MLGPGVRPRNDAELKSKLSHKTSNDLVLTGLKLFCYQEAYLTQRAGATRFR
jgi:hypothetical protein